ncbi:MAG: B12-binding domain-containing radical SAM protein [Candidatus Omnitrophota bacterium]
MKTFKDSKILLVLLPFWTPLIPPPGIAGLKSFLQGYGFRVKAVDANIEPEFKYIHDKYFDTLRAMLPEDKWGNFFKVGYEVLRNHLMAHINHTEPGQYIALVKLLIYRNYYVNVNDHQVFGLNGILDEFYARLETYVSGLLEKETPDVLGVSTTVGTLPATMVACEVTKRKYPHIMTVMGGCLFSWSLHQSPDFDVLLEKVPYIDKIIIGEGEQLFLKLLQGELPASQRVYSLQDIDGKELDISQATIPDLSDFDLQAYPYLVASGSIGCSFQCGFCNFPSLYGKYRKKEAKRIVDEMTALYRAYKSQIFFMSDLLINPILPELSTELLKSERMFYWDVHMRLDEPVTNPENTLLWRRAGLYRARLGLESGSQRVLNLMNKKITVDQAKAAISSLAYAGIKTSVFIVVGFPGETEADFQQTLDFIEEMKHDIWHVESTPFQYFYTGQVEADEWARHRKLLYPAEFRDMLVTQTWILDCEPTQEDTYDRVNRLEKHLHRLNIPDPFSSLENHYYADERWKRLHENAVPSLVEFKSNDDVDEKNNIKTLILAEKKTQENAAFRF